MKDLGYMNGWKETPKIVKMCDKEKHDIRFDKVGRCVTQVTCKNCGYSYKIDSGD